MATERISSTLRTDPGRTAFSFLEDGERIGARLSRGDLDARARAIGAALERRVGAGERALLAYPPGLDFVAAFLGCLFAGVVAVPVHPPRGGPRGGARLTSILKDSGPRAILTVSSLVRRLDGIDGPGDAEGLPRIASDRIDPASGHGWEPGRRRPRDLAFLQYTSGSTGAPKGVCVSHGNLEHNESLIQRAFETDEESVIVGWLPLFHDMGLIGNVLQPLWLGARCVLMAPTAFLQRPARWLEAITRHRATVSGGPDFAYALCARRAAAEEDLALDLSSWRVAFDGSEPVRASTLDAFARTFAPYGFRREAFYPCYGLAESTLFVTGGRVGEEPVEEILDRERLAAGEAVLAPPEAPAAAPYVGSGRTDHPARNDCEVAIVDPEACHRLPAGAVGEIWTRGPSVAGGYWQRPELSRATFAAQISGEPPTEGGWLRTGDLGLIHRGELFVTGRAKDLIIVRGRNLYPQDVERTVERTDEALRPGGSGAFSVDVGDEERLVVVAEVHRRARIEPAELTRTVRQAVAEEHEVHLHELVLLRHGALPKTTSGKVRRHACREGYLAGTLVRLVPADGASGGAGDDPPRSEARARDRPSTPLAPLEAYLAAHLEALRLEAPDDSRRPLAASGVDSLLATELSGRVERDLGASIPLAVLLGDGGLAAAAAALRRALRVASAAPDDPSEPVVEIGDHPASWQQQGIWFLETLSGGRGLYNVAAAARTDRPLDLPALEGAFERVVERHAALRTRFVEGPDGLTQRVAAAGEARLEVVDARTWSGARCRDDLERASLQPFDLAGGSLLRVRVLRRRNRDLVLLAAHHTVVDFLSLVVLVGELGQLYSEAAGGAIADLPAPAGTYAAYARRQRRLLAGPRGEALLHHWAERLGTDPPVLELPTDRPRPAQRGWEGETVVHPLTPALSDACRRLAATRGVTLFSLLLGGFATLLGRLSGQRELMVGSPAAGRGDATASGVVGLFADPLPLRLDLGRPFPAFHDLLDGVAETVADALDHQGCPFALLAQRLQSTRAPGRSPLFDVLFVLDRAPEAGPAGELAEGMEAFALRTAGGRMPFGPNELESLDLPQKRAPLDLVLGAGTIGGRLLFSLVYDRALFDRTTARRWLGHLETLLGAAVADPSRAVDELPLLSPEQRRQILSSWSGDDRTRSAGTGPRTLHGRVLEQARRTPDAVAVEGGGRQITYAGLDRTSARLARALRRRGVAPESRVAVDAVRSPELLVALLGVLRAGAAYVPIDPSYPAERRALMFEDSGARLLLAPGDPAGAPSAEAVDAGPGVTLADLLASEPTIEPDDRPARCDGSAGLPDVPADTAAYMIYTSGSTGRPKAVTVAHRGAAALLDWAREAFSDRETSGVLATTSACFDVSVFELFAPLDRGGRVLVTDNVLALPELPTAGRATLLCAVPSALAELVRLAPLPGSLATVALAGEALPGELVRAIGRRSAVERIWNVYGPTEDTVYSTAARLSPAGEDTTGRPAAPPIGRPLPGTRVYVVDGGLRAVTPGVAGELLLGGAGTARGYHGRPALTAERFVPDPFTDPTDRAADKQGGGRLYRTGDRVRFRADGVLEFLGRLDQQIKVRGFRVEPGEVASVLTGLPGIAEAVVVGRGGGLHAYAVPEVADRADQADQVGGTAAPDSGGRAASAAGRLLDQLRDRLPAYLVPATLTLLDRLPRTATGKLDRRALPEPVRTVDHSAARAATEAPRGELERAIAALWCELLERPAVGRRQDFFGAGGHSLLAARLVSRLRTALSVDLPLAAVFEAPTVAELARRLAAHPADGAAGGGVAPDPRPRALGRTRAPLSTAQERLWLLAQWEQGGSVLSVPFAVELAGPLDAAAFAAAWRGVAHRHGALRTHFPAGPDGPIQEVAPPPVPAPPMVDLEALPPAAADRVAARLATAAARRPFDLARGPLARLELLRRGPERHTALLAFHHTVVDGWSLGLVLQEIAALYGGYGDVAGARSAPRPPDPLQLTDVAVWERERLAGGPRLQADLDHWREVLAGARPVEIPADRPRTAGADFAGALATRRLTPGLASSVAAWSRARATTPFVTLLSAFEALLVRLTGERDLVVGTPVANRPLPELEGVVGCLLDTVALRTHLPADGSFTGLVHAVRATTVEAFAHARVPFDRLVAELAPPREPGRQPVFETLFVLQNAPLPELSLPGRDGGRPVELTVEPIDQGGAQYELSLEISDRDGELTCVAEYRRSLFDPATVDLLLERFERLLAAALEQPETPIDRLPLLSDAERRQVIEVWSGAAASTPTSTEPLDPALALAGAAARHPDRTALVAAGRTLSYGALERAARTGARRLAADGAGPERLVAVHLARSPEAIAALFAVLRTGAAYLPLDPEMPRRRLQMLLEDARPPLVVSDADDLDPVLAEVGERTGFAPRRLTPAALFGDGERPAAAPSADGSTGPETGPETGGDLERWLDAAPDPRSAAYVIYTSGTTGRPKGVVVPRGAFAAYVDLTGRSFGLGEDDRVLQFTSLSFDASIEEVFCTLGRGATLVLREDAMLGSVDGLVDAGRRHRLTVLDFPTAYWHRLAAAIDEEGAALPPSVRLVILGGEQARPDRLTAWRARVGDRVRLVNSYGPTEATITVTQCEIAHRGDDAGWQGAIGGPIPGARLYLLDRRLEPVAPGATGELWIGGAPVSRGYLRRPAATAERFRPDPFGPPGARLYGSGDRARQAPGGDGTLWFQGRIDRQVKLRGYRIEPAEVEAALERQETVTEAVVDVRETAPGDPRLVAWVCPAPGAEPTPGDLIDALAGELPAYMLPAAVVRLPELPRQPSGKVARHALPDPGPDDLAAPAGAEVAAPSPTEELIAQVWAEVLGLPSDHPVGPDDDFFALGGHSILATRALARLRALFGVDLPLRTLFEAPTARRVARRLEAGERAGDGAAEPPAFVRLEPGTARRLSYSQERLWFLDRVQPSAAYNLTGGLRLEGELSVPRLAGALGTLLARHDVLRSRLVRHTGEPVQEVVPEPAVRLPLVDLSALPAPSAERQAARVLAADAGRLFDLARGPLLRTTLVRRSAHDHDLVTSLHHTVGDGWSVGLMLRELAAAYSGDDDALPRLALQYGDWAEWQRRWLEAGEMERQLGFWRRRLADLPTLRLPLDRPRPETPTHRGALARFELPEALRRGVEAIARTLDATPFMVLLAAFDLLLARWSGQREVVVGTDVAGRRHREVEPLIGFFVNSLVLRTDLGGDPTFTELVDRVRDTVLDASAHQDVPFHRVVEEVNPPRRPGANPLFQVMFILDNTPRGAASLPGLVAEPLAWETTSSVFDLSLTLEPAAGAFAGTLRYSTELFSPATAEQIARGYRDLLDAVVAHPGERLARFDVHTPQPSTRRPTAMKDPRDRLGKLMRTRPQSVGAGELVSLAPLLPSGRLPLLASPSAPGVDLGAWLAGHRETVESALADAGAVLFRGFEVNDLPTFEATARSLGFDLMGYGERSSPRTALASGVFTSTDHPADQPIILHLEQSYTLDWPMKIWFGCLEPAREGGATPLADSRRILERIDPEIVDELERRQVMYVRNYGDGLGLTWQVAFQTEDPSGVERHCSANDIAFEWRSEDRLRTRQVRPAVRTHPKTGERVWFNHAVFFHVTSLDPKVAGPLLAGLADDELPYNTLYGDGEPIPDEVLDDLRAAFAAETVRFPWQRGDLLLVDNMLAAHGREPYSGPRRVVVAMAEAFSTVAPRQTVEA